MQILFITYTRIGDAVLSTGILNQLMADYPKARFTIACGPVAAPLFEAAPNVERIIAMPKRKYAGHWRDLWKECRGTKWDMIVDLRRSVVPYLLRAKKRYVLGKCPSDKHRVEHLGSLLGLNPPPSPRLWVSEKHIERANTLLPEGRLIGLGATANWRGKRWRPEYFAELAKRIGKGKKIVLFGAPGEEELVQPIVDKIPECLNLVGKIDLLTAYACLQRLELYISNDTGLMHMAAAAGTPTLGLFGPSPAVHYAPWGAHTAYVETPISYKELVNDPRFDHRTTDSLMDSLSVDMVEEAVKKFQEKLAA